MNNIKRISLLTIALSLFSIGAANTAVARENTIDPDRAEQRDQRLEDVKARLNLSDEQVKQITPILEQSFEKRAAVLKKHGIDLQNRSGPNKKLGLRGARKLGKEMDTVRGDTLTQLDDILSDDQIKEFKKIQSEAKAEMRAKMKARR